MCLNPGTKFEQCPAPGCGKYFSSTLAGDAHRVGEHGVTEGPDRRRCLTTEEMITKKVERGVLAGQTWFTVRQCAKGHDIWGRRQPANTRWDVAGERSEALAGVSGSRTPTQGSKPSEMDLREAA